MGLRALIVVLCFAVSSAQTNQDSSSVPCQGSGLKYLQGDAISGVTSCIGPDNSAYPKSAIDQMFKTNLRKSRSSKIVDPLETQKTLLRFHEAANYGKFGSSNQFTHREDRSVMSDFQSSPFSVEPQRRPMNGDGSSCSGPGNRLCRTRYNTTAPLYGVSLTSGQPVTIVQKFPDLLQQVIYEVCDSSECDVVQGECVQTYVPYLFLVIPLGPVTLTGQDYVLVENGCVCRPKYARNTQESSLTDVLPGFNN